MPTLALVAHDHRKDELLAWVASRQEAVAAFDLVATGTTGRLLGERLGLDVRRLRSGPLGGDQQLGALIAEGGVDLLVFFWDPMEPMPHDPDVKALLRLAVVWDIPVVSNVSTADLVFSSPLLQGGYRRVVPDAEDVLNRPLPEV